MKWDKVREIFPNQFVKVEILKSHIENDNEIIDEVAVIGPVDENVATKELVNSKARELVYHTSKETASVKIRHRIGLRGFRQ